MATVLKIGAKKTASGKAAVATAKPGAATGGGKVTKVKEGKAKTGGAVAGAMVGKTTGLSILKYQNLTLEQNRKKRLTDEQLAQLWRSEHPNSKAVLNGNIDAAMVRAVRNNYNLGKHGNDAPAVPIPQFDEGGQPVAAWGEKAAAKKEKAQKDAAVERVKKGVVVKKKTAK